MQIQYALDLMDIREALGALQQIGNAVDIVEIGTPMIIRFGLSAVEEIKRAQPKRLLLADAKIMDGGEFEAGKCFEAGTDIVTVMALAYNETIRGVVRSARRAGGKVLADMMRVEEPVKRAKELIQMGIDYICVHSATDALDTNRAAMNAEQLARELPAGHLAIAGGITEENIGRLKRCAPEILVIGRAITAASDPRAMALALRAAYEAGDQPA